MELLSSGELEGEHEGAACVILLTSQEESVVNMIQKKTLSQVWNNGSQRSSQARPLKTMVVLARTPEVRVPCLSACHSRYKSPADW